MSSPPLQEPTYFILITLAGGPAHGYRLLQLIEELSEGRVRLRTGTLYAALDRLERDGHIALDSTGSDGGPPRRSFTLTEAGRQLLQAEVDRLRSNVALGQASLRPGMST